MKLMLQPEYKCDNCDSTIIQYYNEHYRGTRGKCLTCEIDFPLE